MASNRHLGRIVALQTLYEYDFRAGLDPEADLAEITERNIDEFKKAVGDRKFVQELIQGAFKQQAKIDKIIGPAAPEWPVEQIARIDKIILRIAVFELLMHATVPPKVAINEAVELGKSFGGENSSKFVNGVLGTIFRTHIEKVEKGAKKKDAKKPSKTH